MNLHKMIASDLRLDENYIKIIVGSADKKYSRYKIPKKDGTLRQIFHPSPELKTIQYWLLRNVFNCFDVSKYSRAYEAGNSIKKNATVHKDGQYILKMDITSFFPTITASRLRSYIVNNKDKVPFPLDDNDINFIVKASTYKGHLVIGSVCAPKISNIIMYEFDIKMAKLAKINGGLKYSRYADDLTFSSKEYIDYAVVKKATEIITQEGFSVNKNKTRFSSPRYRRMITGLMVDNGEITIGTSKKKELKSLIYQYFEHKKGNPKELLGYLSFLKDVEPVYLSKLIIKYSSYGNIMKILKEDSKECS